MRQTDRFIKARGDQRRITSRRTDGRTGGGTDGRGTDGRWDGGTDALAKHTEND